MCLLCFAVDIYLACDNQIELSIEKERREMEGKGRKRDEMVVNTDQYIKIHKLSSNIKKCIYDGVMMI